jgi:hypothetical protein
MAFTYRTAKNLSTDGLFDFESAKKYLLASSIFPHYMSSKVMYMDLYRQPIPEEPQHYVSGDVVEEEIPVSRRVYLHRSDTGALVGSAVSGESTGSFYVTTTYSGSHYVICLDDEVGEDYNGLIFSKIIPGEIT